MVDDHKDLTGLLLKSSTLIPIRLILTFANRWGSCHGTPVITTAIRGKNRLHNVIIFSNENDVVHFKEKFEPHLLQLKHDNIPTHIGTEDVAPFTLWNKNDEGPA